MLFVVQMFHPSFELMLPILVVAEALATNPTVATLGVYVHCGLHAIVLQRLIVANGADRRYGAVVVAQKQNCWWGSRCYSVVERVVITQIRSLALAQQTVECTLVCHTVLSRNHRVEQHCKCGFLCILRKGRNIGRKVSTCRESDYVDLVCVNVEQRTACLGG